MRRAARLPMDAVIVMWMAEPGMFHALAYRNGNGLVRTYQRDCYDPRAGLGLEDGALLPHFDNAAMAADWLSRNLSARAQVSVRAALRLGFRLAELSPL